MYLTADGKPSHIIADLRDGRQQKLHPTTLEVIDTYGQIGGKSKGHYRKQKNEKVLLMPGAAEESAVVREIFELHFRKGWGGKRIADLLNRRGVRSPQGRAWSQHQVEVIYEQEAYTGRSVGNRTSSAIYHERQPSAPKRVDLDPAVQAAAKRIPVRQRGQGEWFIQPQPLMEHFLDAELRRLAMDEHERLWRRRGDIDRPKQPKGKHRASDYLLSGLLYAKQDGEPLVGVRCGRVGNKVRYYRHRRGRRGYIKDSVFNKMIPAQPIEDAVVALVAAVLTSDETLRDRIIAFVEAEARRTTPTEQIADMQKRRDQIRRRTELIVSTLDEETLADARAELDRLKAERRTLDEQVAVASARGVRRGRGRRGLGVVADGSDRRRGVVVELRVVQVQDVRRAVAHPLQRVLVGDVVARAHRREGVTERVELVLVGVGEAEAAAQAFERFQQLALAHAMTAVRVAARRAGVEDPLAGARPIFQDLSQFRVEGNAAGAPALGRPVAAAA